MKYWFCLFALASAAAAGVLPEPQSTEMRPGWIAFPKSQPVTIVLGASPDRATEIAADLLVQEFQGYTVRRSSTTPVSGTAITLRDCAREGLLPGSGAADRELLSVERHFGQSYLLDAGSGQLRIAGSTGIGLLYGVATAIQLLERDGGGIRLAATVIRDYPSFRYRAASDWLLRAELNRWAYDWGDGNEAYAARIRRKLDFCARFKINMVMFDGFGWSTARRPGYATLVRELNHYARDRGIKLMFSGFGANFDPAKVEPEFHIGRVILNRHGYPYGPVYQCFGETRTAEHPTYGTCRSNDGLLHEIATDFEEFVRAVEPGALYVHHEDTGNYQTTQARWAARCDDCKRRWPNQDFAAADGGAGAMARGYSNILEAVNRVRNKDTGYDGARDCTVVFISPPYAVDSGREGVGDATVDSLLNWNKTLEFWTNVLTLMPKARNFEVGFREIFAGPGGRQWVDIYREHMLARGLNPNVFIFFLGGADQYSSGSFSFPFTGSPVMDGIFDGAESLYNFNGGLHQESQQALNAAYSWNSHSPGRLVPPTFESGVRRWHALMQNEELPEAIFGRDGVFASACAKIYGAHAGAAMARFQFFQEDRRTGDLPVFYPTRLHALTVLWRLLQGDEAYWDYQPSATEELALKTLHIGRAEFQNRLAKFWRQSASVNVRAETFVQEALEAGDLRADAREDAERLRLCLRAGEQIAALMAAYHDWLAQSGSREEVALRCASVSHWLRDHVRADFTDPKGGDASSWFETTESIRSRLNTGN